MYLLKTISYFYPHDGYIFVFIFFFAEIVLFKEMQRKLLLRLKANKEVGSERLKAELAAGADFSVKIT